MLGNVQIQSTKQSQKINTQQIQFLNFLFLNQQELDRYVNKELLENPFIEPKGNDQTDNYEDDSFSDNSLTGEMRNEEVFSKDVLEDDQPYYKLNNAGASGPADSEWHDLRMSRITEEQSATEIYEEQLRFQNLPDDIVEIATFLIHSTDGKGFLNANIEEVTDNLCFASNKFYEEEKVLKVKEILNRFEPLGFASFDLQDYLITLTRLDTHLDEELKNTTLKVLQEGFEDLSKSNPAKISERLKIEPEKLQECLEFITSLNPYPTKGMSSGGQEINHNITPDYEIIQVDDKLIGRLISSKNYSFSVKEDYAASMKTTARNGTNSYISGKLKSAHWLIDAIEQRRETMTKVIEAITYLQGEYLVSGDYKKLRPMILKDVAEYIGMNISTVSRVTSNKYARTPIGLVHLKDLFSEGIYLESGERKSNKEIQEMVINLVEQEDKKNPLSDFDIQKILKKEGINLTRRTITKYRRAENIPSSLERKSL